MRDLPVVCPVAVVTSLLGWAQQARCLHALQTTAASKLLLHVPNSHIKFVILSVCYVKHSEHAHLISEKHRQIPAHFVNVSKQGHANNF